jgi:hypothetical protein
MEGSHSKPGIRADCQKSYYVVFGSGMRFSLRVAMSPTIMIIRMLVRGFLDQDLQYSCAYFAASGTHPVASTGGAQDSRGDS